MRHQRGILIVFKRLEGAFEGSCESVKKKRRLLSLMNVKHECDYFCIIYYAHESANRDKVYFLWPKICMRIVSPKNVSTNSEFGGTNWNMIIQMLRLFADSICSD